MSRLLAFGCLLLLFSGVIQADDTVAAGTKTVKIAKGPFKIDVSLEGIFESKTMSEIILRPDEWTELTIKEVVPHGARVKKGDVILQLDPRKILEAIHDLETGLHVAELTIAQNESELRTLEPMLPLDMAAAQRSKRIADEDLERFSKLERELAAHTSEQSLKSSKMHLENEQAELNELEKMYKADDLTEETEEIILKRQRDSVDMAKFHLELAQIEHEKTLKLELPRREETLKDAALRQSLLFEKARTSLPLAVEKLKNESEKLKIDHHKSLEKYDRLKKDLAGMTVKAPADGVVYYGGSVLGNWTSSIDLAAKLRRGGAVVPNEIMLTVVDAGALFVRATVPEKQLSNLRRGETGSASWADSDDCKCDVKVDSLSAVPISPGKFTAVLEIANFDPARCSVPPLPGMSCTVTLHAYAKEDAIAVPTAALQADDWDESKEFVYVVNAENKREKRLVAVGRKTDKKVEILKGLTVGEVILPTKPEE